MSEKKDFLDKLSSMSTLKSGVVIAMIGTSATIVYYHRQQSIEEAQLKLK